MDFLSHDSRLYIDPVEEMKLYRAANPLPTKLIYSPFNQPRLEKTHFKGKFKEFPTLKNGTHLYCINDEVAYFQGLMGAPMTAIIIERFIALGITEIIFLGLAGAIQQVSVGDRILVTEALRLEGTSYHYLPAHIPSCASTELTTDLEQYCLQHDHFSTKGKICSTDALYRETFDLIERLRQEHVLAIEMEISAVFAVALYKQVAASAMVIISDELKDDRWGVSNPLRYSNPYFSTLEFLVGFFSQR